MTFTEAWEPLPHHSSTPAPWHIGDKGLNSPSQEGAEVGAAEGAAGTVKILANSFFFVILFVFWLTVF